MTNPRLPRLGAWQPTRGAGPVSILIVLIILIGTAHYLRWRASPTHIEVLRAQARNCGKGVGGDGD